MTDSPSGPAPLTPEEEAAVSRMLAGAAGPVAMPDDVATRLQGVLDDLVTDRADSPAEPRDGTGGEVVSLRARRRWPKVLLAAATVVAGGYGVTAALGNGTLAGSESASSADSAVAGQAEAEAGASQLQDRGRDDRDDGEAGSDRRGVAEYAPSSAADLVRSGGPVRLRSVNLPDGALRALRVLELSDSVAPEEQQYGVTPRCSGPATDDGERLAVRYDGEPAVLVAGPSQGGLVEVTIYSCEGSVLDSAVVVR